MRLSGPILKSLATYYPDGADIFRRLDTPPHMDAVHVQRLDGTDGALVGGRLKNDPVMAGLIGMPRSTYMSLGVHSEE